MSLKETVSYSIKMVKNKSLDHSSHDSEDDANPFISYGISPEAVRKRSQIQ